MSQNARLPGMRRKPMQARSQERVERILETAENLFIKEGYEATTTNAIAKQSKVSIGSLYQFFPDKAAILHALAMRYGDLLQQKLVALSTDEVTQDSLSAYAEQLIDTTTQFFADYPGYHAVFMEAQSIEPKIGEIEDACDAQVVTTLAATLAQRDFCLESDDCDAIAFVLVKAIGTVLWLSLREKPAFQQRLVIETKRLTLAYLKSYHRQDEQDL